MRRIVLASTSPYRRQLLERLGLRFECMAPRFAETLPPGCDPADLVLRQAEGKARSLAADHPDALVIGSDQVVELEGEVLGKPGTAAAAIDQLARMAGKEHRLVTAVVVVDAASGRGQSHLEITPLRMRPLTGEEIRAYVERENPIDCAGSYKSEGLGAALFEYQRGDDPSAAVGLPLIALCRLLRGFGVDVLNPPSTDR